MCYTTHKGEMMNKTLRLRIIERYGTQADFAQDVRVDESLVSRVIRGRRRLSSNDQKRWAKYLRSKPGKLFGKKGCENKVTK